MFDPQVACDVPSGRIDTSVGARVVDRAAARSLRGGGERGDGVAASAQRPGFFDCCRAGIAELLEADAAIDVLERTIDAYALDREEKAVLWLWAAARPARSRRLAVDVRSTRGALRARPELVYDRRARGEEA